MAIHELSVHVFVPGTDKNDCKRKLRKLCRGLMADEEIWGFLNNIDDHGALPSKWENGFADKIRDSLGGAS